MRRVLTILSLLLVAGCAYAMQSDTLVATSWEFVENKGQLPDNVLYSAKSHDGAVFFEEDRYTVVQYNHSQLDRFYAAKHSGEKIDMKMIDAFAYQVTFLNSKPAFASGTDKFHFYRNYYIEKDKKRWASGVGVYKNIEYDGIYDNINLVFNSKDGYLKYEFHVFPGGDCGDIKMEYSGLKKMVVTGNELLLTTDFSRIVELRPFAYQIGRHGDTVGVACRYHLDGNVVSFDVGEYDHALPVIIDPTVVFSSFSGSTADNWGYTATYDSHGNLYGGGISFGTGYPTTLGAFQVDFCGQVDVAISKFDATGSSMIYSTYIGGSKADIPHSLVVNNNDELYIFGTTGSDDFPVTANAFDTSFNGGASVTLSTNISFQNGSDIFVSKLNADGTQLVASTYVGGTGNDGIVTATGLRKNYADDNRGEIEVDDNSNVYVVTITQSEDFPTTSSVYQSQKHGSNDACVFKMSQDLSSMIWSTYFGGGSDDAGYCMALAQDKSIYFCGGTLSSDFPALPSYQSSQADGGDMADGFVAHLSSNGASLLHFTYLGKTGFDQAYLVENDKFGNIYVFGQTYAEDIQWVYNASFYVPNGGQFLIKLYPNLKDVWWSTAFGSGNLGPDISPTAFMTDYCNNIYLSGWGSGQLNGFGGTSGLPVTDDAVQTTTDGSDFYFMAIQDDASSLVYATYFGGASSSAREHVDGGTSRFDKHGAIYQAVCAGCGGQSSFPTTYGAYSQVNGSSNCNLGVIKIDFGLPTAVADFQAPTVVCLPDAVSFANNSQAASAQISAYWDFGDGTTSTEWSPTHVYQNPGNYTVTLVVSDEQSCNYSDTLRKQIFVFSNASSYLSTQNICADDYAELGIPPATGVSYHWEPENSLNNPDISNPIATPSGTTTYILIASTEACVDTFYQVVEVHSLEISGEAVSSGVAVCKGESAVISVNISSDDDYSILWSETPDFQNVIANGQTQIEVSPEQSTDYYLKVSTDYCVKVLSVHVRVVELGISAKDEYLLCFDNELQMSAMVVGGDAPYQYLWTVEGVGTSADAMPEFVVPHTSSYSVVVTDANGCQASAGGMIIVAEGTFPEELHAWCNPEQIFAYHQTTLFSTDYGSDYTYQWLPEDGLSNPDAPSTSATASETMVFTVTVTDTFGCTKTDTVLLRVEPVTCESPHVFIPNSFSPNGDGINDVLYVRSDILDECHFVIYGRWGEKIFETDSKDIGWDGTFKNKECQRGVYDYYFKGRCLDGDEIEIKGNVTLIR